MPNNNQEIDQNEIMPIITAAKFIQIKPKFFALGAKVKIRGAIHWPETEREIFRMEHLSRDKITTFFSVN